jgi:hypothetical protein
VVLDARLTRIIDASELHMATDYSPYEGMAVTGWPDTVVANGRVVIECGELVADPGPVGTFPACGVTLGDGLLSRCRRPTKATAYGPASRPRETCPDPSPKG